MSNQSSHHQYGELEAARTAMKLVERVGEDYGSHKVFEGKTYTIAQLKPDPQITRLNPNIKGQLSIIAKDGRGEILRLNNKEFTSKLQAQDVNKFARSEQELNKHRSRQQQSSQSSYKQPSTPAMIPKKGEIEATKTAANLIKLLGEDYGSHKIFEGKSYTITQLKPDPQVTRLDPSVKGQLSIVAKDGRGEILRLNNKEFISKLQDKDIHKFAQMGQKISEYQSKQQNNSQSQEAELLR